MKTEKFYKFATWVLSLILAVTLTQSLGLSPSSAKPKKEFRFCTEYVDINAIEQDYRNLGGEANNCVNYLQKSFYRVVEITTLLVEDKNSVLLVFRGER